MLTTRHYFPLFSVVSLGLLLAGGTPGVHSAPRPVLQAQQAFGSITGTISNEQHQSIHNAHALITSGVVVTAEPQANAGVRNPDAFGRGVFGAGETSGRRAASDANAGGLYTLDKLKPGVYNLTVEAGERDTKPYRPLRIMGVVVRPGQETSLDITLHPGDTLEEAGEPTLSDPSLKQFGWLEGTIVTPEGRPVHSARALIATGVSVTISNASGKLGDIKTDHMAGGFFSIQNLHVGTYSFLVETGEFTGPTRYRPQQVRNIVVKPGIRTVLNIVMPEGTELQRAEAQPKVQTLKLPTDPTGAKQ